MPEKSAAATQSAPSSPPVKAPKAENLAERTDLFDAISRRAYELYEQEGRVDGNDLRNWLEAEREILHPVQMKIEETEGGFAVRAELPGFTAGDIEVTVEPRRVTITGKRQSTEDSKQGEAVYAEERMEEIYRTLELPGEVNVMKVTATLKEGILDVRLPKVEVAKRVSVATESA
jgi:HSP20 family protein